MLNFGCGDETVVNLGCTMFETAGPAVVNIEIGWPGLDWTSEGVLIVEYMVKGGCACRVEETEIIFPCNGCGEEAIENFASVGCGDNLDPDWARWGVTTVVSLPKLCCCSGMDTVVNFVTFTFWDAFCCSGEDALIFVTIG